MMHENAVRTGEVTRRTNAEEPLATVLEIDQSSSSVSTMNLSVPHLERITGFGTNLLERPGSRSGSN